ncbi:ATP-binding cassette domain-containing protein [Gracilibacillus salitolerans]|uniref:ATP-binding cassette domain-containing protein n=1 Tax=Gracilibacillus salitolerans TaxID=2663022 RepID=A0A5Q2TG87_9BACI|nr:ATP-binding cassette domain-containing protein [Gracilibacillus salitolerans]QGH33834.1 ATP-binding cassette domain-containing protein [Gracilibacillus salitolerans]
MLKVEKLSYTLPNRKTLFRDISLTLAKGEIVGLSGASGVGKTTFAKVITGYLSAESGEINYKPVKNKPYPVQLIWQHPEQSVNPKWRLQKVLEEAGEINKQLLDQLNIPFEWLPRYPHQLSGGQLQRICIARCLLTNPSYIIADEMTTMLDPIAQAEIWQLVTEYVKNNKVGLLIISHDRLLLDNLCEKVIDFTQFVKPTDDLSRNNHEGVRK